MTDLWDAAPLDEDDDPTSLPCHPDATSAAADLCGCRS